MRLLALALTLPFVLPTTAAWGAQEELRPVPGSEEFEARTRKARRQYEVRRAKTREQKSELARRLEEEASLFGEVPTDRYVVLRLAYEVALGALELDLALGVVRALATEYQPVDADALERRALQEVVGDRNLGVEDFGSGARRLLLRVHEDLEQGRAAEAKELLVKVRSRCRKSKDKGLRALFDEADGRQKRVAVYEDALGKLAEDPRDAEANAIAGKYHFLRGEFGRAMGFLARTEGDMASCAKLELSGPDTRPSWLARGARWLDYSKTSRDHRGRALERARHWYERALPELDFREGIPGDLDLFVQALETLELEPSNVEANAIAGQTWLRFGHFERAMPLLAKSELGLLEECACAELASPGDALGRREVGDRWYGVASAGGVARDLRDRAAQRADHWYRRAIEGQAGLDRRELELALESRRRKLSRRADDDLDRVQRAAVDRGLDLLVSSRTDGHWLAATEKESYHVGVTGLAVLALLADGNTLERGYYAGTLGEAAAWLRTQQDPKSGGFDPGDAHDRAYGHAIATLALCELARVSPRPDWEPSLQLAVGYIERGRNPYGAWRYGDSRGRADGQNDTSVTGWMLLALDAARELGLQVNGEPFAEAVAWMDEVTDPETGRVGYDSLLSRSSRTQGNQHFPPDKGEAMTAVALRSRLLAGARRGRDPILGRHAALLLKAMPCWKPDDHVCDFYYWYHGTAALAALGGREAKAWNQELLTTLSAGQEAGGAWPAVGAWCEVGGESYATALALLSMIEATRK